MKKLLNLFTKNAANPIEGLANTALSLIRDKTRDSDTSYIRENIRKGVSISSKRVLNFTGTGAILTVALFLIQKNGLDALNEFPVVYPFLLLDVKSADRFRIEPGHRSHLFQIENNRHIQQQRPAVVNADDCQIVSVHL